MDGHPGGASHRTELGLQTASLAQPPISCVKSSPADHPPRGLHRFLHTVGLGRDLVDGGQGSGVALFTLGTGVLACWPAIEPSGARRATHVFRQRTGVLVAAIALAGCGGATGSSGLAAPSAPASPSQLPTAVPSAYAPELVGTWTRTQDCQAMLTAFEEADLAASHPEWIIGNWVGDPADVQVDPNNLCAKARPPEEHFHFFTEDGQFGSLDAAGNQVDDGNYAAVDNDTVSFPSHGTEFGYDGDILVDYAVNGDTAEFEVQVPPECDSSCLQAHAWALSAFFGGERWTRTE